MKVKFQYVDWTEWEGPPDQAHESPDKGVIRMWGITNDDRRVEFVYDDLYYIYQEPDGDWIMGSGTTKRDFRFSSDGVSCIQCPVVFRDSAVVRYGQTVSQEEAVKFGLIDSLEQKHLHEKRFIPVKRKACCG